jgi:dienelactone hydrolase
MIAPRGGNNLLHPRAVLALLLTLGTLPAAAAEPPVHIRETPDGVRFALWGEKPAAPAPTLFVFAAGLKDMQRVTYYTEIGRILAGHGFLYVALDPPCHGDDVKPGEPPQLGGWRQRLEKGDGLIAPFTRKASQVLDHLIKEKYTDSERVAACGTSRGGFLAYHFAVADRRIRAVAGFSPVTNLLVVTEFAGLEKNEAARSLTLTNHAAALAGRAVWLSIGNNDNRVGTDDAIAFTRKVVAETAARRKGPDTAIPVELVVGAAAGHTGIAREHAMAAAWIHQQLGGK